MFLILLKPKTLALTISAILVYNFVSVVNGLLEYSVKRWCYSVTVWLRDTAPLNSTHCSFYAVSMQRSFTPRKTDRWARAGGEGGGGGQARGVGRGWRGVGGAAFFLQVLLNVLGCWLTY